MSYKTHTAHPLPDVVDAPGEREARPFELVQEPPKHVAVPDLLDEHQQPVDGPEDGAVATHVSEACEAVLGALAA